MNGRDIRVAVVYARAQAAFSCELRLRRGARVDDALRHSGVFERYPEIDAERCAVGVWGRVAERDRLLDDGDRVEVYRPLLADPKQARRERVTRVRRARAGRR